MRKRFWRKLAGCCAIELICASSLCAAQSEYRAGAAALGQARAVALEDRAGVRAVIAEADFAITRHISDAVAARAMLAYGLDRDTLVLRGAGAGPAVRLDDLLDAIGAALGALQPAALRLHRGSLWVGRAIAAIGPEGAISMGAAAAPEAQEIYGPIRAAFQMVDLTEGLRRRDYTLQLVPVQAISFGKQAAILALPGDAPVADFREEGLIVAPFCNDNAAFPDNPRVREAIRGALRRVGRN
jgi:hypothetical protein